MARKTQEVNLFEFLDYREYLRHWYQCKKIGGSSGSYRAFSKRAGFKSVNFFKFIMDGDRNLTSKSLPKFVRGLGLNKQEIEYFENLVWFTQAESHEEKDKYYKKLLKNRKFKKLKPMAQNLYDYFGEWYHVVIRELLVAKECRGNLKWIFEKIFPKISLEEIEMSAKLLLDLGLVKMNEDGSYSQSDTVLSTGDECPSLAIMNYHKRLLSLSSEQLDRIDSHRRDVSSLTLGVSKDQFLQLKDRIQRFRKEILEIVSEDNPVEEVVFLNIQLLSATEGESK